MAVVKPDTNEYMLLFRGLLKWCPAPSKPCMPNWISIFAHLLVKCWDILGVQKIENWVYNIQLISGKLKKATIKNNMYIHVGNSWHNRPRNVFLNFQESLKTPYSMASVLSLLGSKWGCVKID